MLNQIDNLMSDPYIHDKIKTPYANIIVEKICGMPCFAIEFYDPTAGTAMVGYGSTDLNTVFKWKDEYFEIENPTCDIKPVIYGRWIKQKCEGDYGICSECGCRIPWIPKNYKYCPNCGATMNRGDLSD